MNPDVPSLEACRRLAKSRGEVWTLGLVQYFYDQSGNLGTIRSGVEGPSTNETLLPAPTIGEMGEEIRRRGLRMIVTLERRGDGVQEFGVTIPGMAHAVHEREADARANALSEAIEKEKK
ncbi:hypothetical protein ES708_02740 [subsurface metagenome]